MFNSSARKTLVSLISGALVSAAMTTAVIAQEKETFHVLDRQGKPVMVRAGNCLDAPRSSNQPTKLFEECGDIIDSDGDGVPDDKDECPDTPSGVKVDEKGCPLDSDRDGVPDYRDKCPNNTALEISQGVDADGCPLDSDGDGVPDYRDKCPGTPRGVKVDADGCGIVGQREVTILASDVTFGFDKANLSAAGRSAIDELASKINSNIDLIKDIIVIGHTDSIGSTAYNQKLSERRAKSVADQLISNGVPSSKIVMRGEGESNPIDSNSTKAGRAKNRRVSIDVGTFATK